MPEVFLVSWIGFGVVPPGRGAQGLFSCCHLFLTLTAIPRILVSICLQPLFLRGRHSVVHHSVRTAHETAL